MEKIQTHEVMDVYRLKDGVLIEVIKYESLPHYLHSVKTLKVVRGCKGLKALKEDYTDDYSKKTFPKGTYFMGSRPITLLTNPKDYRFEIKSSGGTIAGSKEQLEKILDDAQTILDSYGS